ncbi:hypothetical protein OB03_10330 [Brevundimonas sp. GN22]
MVTKEIKLFFCAVQFLTRIPTLQLDDFQPEWIQQSARYYPAVGVVVGGVSGCVLWLACLIWSPWIAAVLAVAAGMALTGCFHEDGLADTADGIGGGQTRSRRLEIMKDSRLGTYGASVLFMNLALRILCVGTLASTSPLLGLSCVLAANVMGRSIAVIAMAAMPYGGDPGMAKEGKPDRTTVLNVVIAFSVGALALLPFTPLQATIAVAVGIAVAAIPACLAWRLLGGRTGDVLGAIEQAFEIGFLLAMAAILS